MVGGDLNGGHACGEYDQRSEEDAKDGAAGSGKEADGSGGHDEKADDHGSLVTEPVDELAAGIAEDEVRREESELDEHRFGVAEFEDTFEMRDDDVVKAGEKANHEEEGSRDRHSACVGFDGIGAKSRCTAVSGVGLKVVSFRIDQRVG